MFCTITSEVQKDCPGGPPERKRRYHALLYDDGICSILFLLQRNYNLENGTSYIDQATSSSKSMFDALALSDYQEFCTCEGTRDTIWSNYMYIITI